ncbi:UNVERIFIED_CONTAM: hypothetical protein Sindi_0905400 [Sesamum indicum]
MVSEARVVATVEMGFCGVVKEMRNSSGCALEREKSSDCRKRASRTATKRSERRRWIWVSFDGAAVKGEQRDGERELLVTESNGDSKKALDFC